ncbi:MAG: hypothetical protein LUD83_05225, partial [Clostridiales bacterium]|nr:hypothetical protein [Clostridiales bacterium]
MAAFFGVGLFSSQGNALGETGGYLTGASLSLKNPPPISLGFALSSRQVVCSDRNDVTSYAPK